MSQQSWEIYTGTTAPGSTTMPNIKDALRAAQNMNAEATEPSYKVQGTWWYDTANDMIKWYDGSAWIKVAEVNEAGHSLVLFSGGVAVASVEPAGVIKMYGGAAAPAGYVLCDGSAISRSTYSDLFTAIGTTYGVGDGSTTFNVPDFRGRAPIGSGAGSGLTARSLGDEVGAEDHTLVTGELPAHTHGSAGSHDHSLTLKWGSTTNYNYPNNAIGSSYSSSSDASIADAGAHEHSSVGSDSAHNNMQPSLVVNYIIKT